MIYFYSFLVFLAGFIDSIAGGGGLITVPVFTLLLGPGALAIGTNKIVGLAAASTALFIYARKGHLQIKGSVPFIIGLAIGTFCGAKLGTHLPARHFTWFLIAALPLLLYFILKRDSLLSMSAPHHTNRSPQSPLLLIGLGFLCGGYDGVFGPGGGTFMFLALFVFGGFSLLPALATSKLANTLSAGLSLITYAQSGFVSWSTGLPLTALCIVGAMIGSTIATQNAKRVVRPVLAIVVILLLIRLAVSELNLQF